MFPDKSKWDRPEKWSAMKKPDIKPNDYHIVIADREDRFESQMQIFDASGKLLHKLKCLAKGQNADYRIPKGDTPEGVYRCGVLYETRKDEPWHIWRSFGKYFIDLEEMEDQERKHGRAGVGIHGAGSGLSDPLAPFQPLRPTHGCVRVHNADMENIIVPLYRKVKAAGGNVYVTVYQL